MLRIKAVQRDIKELSKTDPVAAVEFGFKVLDTTMAAVKAGMPTDLDPPKDVGKADTDKEVEGVSPEQEAKYMDTLGLTWLPNTVKADGKQTYYLHNGVSEELFKCYLHDEDWCDKCGSFEEQFLSYYHLHDLPIPAGRHEAIRSTYRAIGDAADEHADDQDEPESPTY
jgi:hypothetical protein